jgi:hypothetical protein
MIFSKKTETETDHPPLDEAIQKYKTASGSLFIKPAKKLCKFEKNAWILFDKDNNLIAIISQSHGAVFADNLNSALRQIAVSFVE